MIGKVKIFIREKGFGFIIDENGIERFYHISNVNGENPQLNDTVKFEPYEEEKGPGATSIEIINSSSNNSSVDTSSMTGRVKKYIRKKGFGFIVDENGIERFYHRSNVDGEMPQKNDAVKFEPYEDHKGSGATSVKIIDSVSNSNKFGSKKLLKEIKSWKMEAKLEDNYRYFYKIQDLDLLENGECTFVLGRKGTGKTAICDYLNSKNLPNYFSEKITFKNFPFNDLYNLNNERYTPPNQFITIWKYIIYSSVAQMMIKNQSIDIKLRSKLEEAYSDSIDKTLKRKISQWTSARMNFVGIGGEYSRETLANDSTWIDKVNLLEDLITDNIDSSKYFILFDELDEDYTNMMNRKVETNYFSLLTSLFKAIQDVKSVFRDKKFNINPVIFLRNDIFKHLRDSDRTKWNDLTIELNWSIPQVKKLIAFRISRAIEASKEPLSFDKAWSQVFHPLPIIRNHGDPISKFRYITRSTHIRPRDYIRYIRDCCRLAINKETNIVNSHIVKKVDKEYSSYFRSELEDEITGIIPEIRDIMDVLSSIRKQHFTYLDFENHYLQAKKTKNIPDRKPEFVLNTLFNFSVIGNQKRNNNHVFRYFDKDANFNSKAPIAIHRGLFKSLQII